MLSGKARTVKISGKNRVLNVHSDTPDIRDRMYEPALIQLQPDLDYRDPGLVLDQGSEGACTGFGLAAVINVLNYQKRKVTSKVSPRMLYEMAQKHDQWPGEDYEGSSCRGAIRGWKNMGVCSEQEWNYTPNKPGELTIERAKAARSRTLGAYYRLRPEVSDYHAALNEVCAIYVSAQVHDGWFTPQTGQQSGLAIIPPKSTPKGGHAFAIVGYNSLGFIVQNSWGSKWGSEGFALWLYEDWLANISDGWVFRLAIPTPNIFGLTSKSIANMSSEFEQNPPKRHEIAGHFVHFDDGKFKKRGTYWSTLKDIKNTAKLIKESVSTKKYNHLLIYAHGGLNSPESSAKRIRALKEGFKRNGIYPFHIMYDTGLVEECKDTILRAFTGRRAEGFFTDLREQMQKQTDLLIEDFLRKPATPVWEEMKADAFRPFDCNNGEDKTADGIKAITAFIEALQDTHLQIHLAGHSTGSVLIGHLLQALDPLKMPNLIQSCSLMAPACSIEFYKDHFKPRLLGEKVKKNQIKLPQLSIYNLSTRLEKDDNVSLVYRKSLLYLISRALERHINKPLLGLQKYSKKLDSQAGLAIYVSKKGAKKGITCSKSHGGFDNDLPTMNSIMTTILGKPPKEPFTENEMKGY